MTTDLRPLILHTDGSLAAWRPHWKAAFALAALPLALVACGKLSGAQPGVGAPGAMPPPEVAVITVHTQSQPVEMEYTGQTAGSRETEVRARVGGILNKRLFEEGAVVQAGAALYQIDPASFQTQLASAEAPFKALFAVTPTAKHSWLSVGPSAAAPATAKAKPVKLAHLPPHHRTRKHDS